MVEQLGRPRMLLVGDFMLDCYVYGDTERISPEAPVPVLKVVREERHTGGAGNVAACLLALGGQVVCVGVVGPDGVGEDLKSMLVTAGAETSSLVRVPNFDTTVKTRFVGLAQHRHTQQMLRVDRECADAITDDVHLTLRAAARSELKRCGALAMQDHDKGVLTDSSTPEIIADARQAGVPVVVDPARIRNYGRYRGATLLTPNRYEAELASGVRITDDESLHRAAGQVLLAAEAQAVLVTLDREGAYLLERDGEGQRILTRPRSVYDVTGAGDEVLAAVVTAVAEGRSFAEAAALANVAGGLEVERFGVVPVTRRELLEELDHMVGLRGGKVVERGTLASLVSRRRERGEAIVFTNGCFDLLHMGHVRYLQEARGLGSCLIVAINSDESVRRLKGPSRPVIAQDERAEMLAALECVDYVTIFDEETPIPLLELLRPEVLAKGGATPVVVGQDVVEGYGGKVLKLSKVEGLSTTDIIDRIVQTSAPATSSETR